MALFSSKKKPLGLGFATMVKGFSPERKAAVLKNLEKHGDAQAVLDRLLALKPLYAEQKLEIYADEGFLMIWQDTGTFSKKENAHLWETEKVSHFFCYSAETVNLVFVFKDGSTCSLQLWTTEEEKEALFTALPRFVPLFDDQAPAETETRFDWGVQHSLVVRPDAVEWTTPTFTGKQRTSLFPTKDIIWCAQAESAEDDGPILKLYMADGTERYIFQATSQLEAYRVAKTIAFYAPHMLYGPSKTYERLFKKDRQKLIALGQAQAAQKRKR